MREFAARYLSSYRKRHWYAEFVPQQDQWFHFTASE